MLAAFPGALSQEPEAAPGITYADARCRLLAEARVGMHPARAAAWVASRHASGQGAMGTPPPRLHFRREPDGATWLALTWQSADKVKPFAISDDEADVVEQQPGGPYLETVDRIEDSKWTTFYPFDEHGCKWHVRGAEADSSGRLHASPLVRSVEATAHGALPASDWDES